MLTPSIRRGLAAGLLAGVLAGLFAFVVGEIPMREAVRLEETLDAPADDPVVGRSDEPEPGAAEFAVPRTTQEALLPVATAVVGAAFGGLFGVLFAAVRRFILDPDDWRASLKLGATTWTVMALVPFAASPPNPPGIGDPSAVGARSGWYLGSILMASALAIALWALAHRLRASAGRDAPRHIVVGTLALVGFGALVLVVPAGGPSQGSAFPGELLWQFRIASFATQTLLWLGIAVAFGFLWDRHPSASTTHERSTA